MAYQDGDILRAMNRVAHEVKEAHKTLKRIEGRLSANQVIASGPHWILVTAKKEAVCSKCAHSIPVVDMIHFSDNRKERPEVCPMCKEHMSDTVEIV